jgi:hypothetical protein
MLPPGVVALPVFSAEPAVDAPWLLASPADGAVLPVVVPVDPFFMAAPPPVVLPFIDSPVVVLLAAGPPAAELPPAVLPPLCAKAAVPESAKAVASAMVVSFIFVSSCDCSKQIASCLNQIRLACSVPGPPRPAKTSLLRNASPVTCVSR